MVNRILPLIILIAIIAAIMGCSGVQPQAPDFNGDTGILDRIASGSQFSLIAFARQMGVYPEPNRDIFVMTPNGAKVEQVTKSPYDDDDPAFSHNGRAIAFVSNRSSGAPYGAHDIFTVTLSGGVKQMTDQAWEFESSSPDYGPGFIIAAQLNTLIGAPFDVVRVTALDPWAGAWQIFVDTKQVASYTPCISYDGQTLIFAARPMGPGYAGSIELYMLKKGWADPIQLTAFGGEDIEDWVYTTNPSFSFDGTKVAFQTTLWDGNTEIAYLVLDDSQTYPLGPEDIVRVTEDPASDMQPSWGPDGVRIAFVTDRNGNFELYTIADPMAPPPDPAIVRLTWTDQDESNPDWSNYY